MDQFRETVEAVRARTSLEELVGRDMELRRAGSVLKGRSPWRRDRDPSFVVWPHTQTWRDFSGNACEGGDCFDYVMRRDGVPFMEALGTLAAGAGIRVDAAGACGAALGELAARRRLGALMTEAAEHWHRALPADVREETLKGHYGFTDETIDALRIGWADGGLFGHLTGAFGASEDEALSTGLFVRTGSGRVADFFQGRIVFPYWLRGRAAYFIARRTERTPDAPWEEAKYRKQLVRSERHPYVSPLVANDTFYNEDAARTPGVRRLLVTEGVADCVSAMQAGVPCISPVTVRFRRKDIPKLLELTKGCSEVVVCNDTEENGAGEGGAMDTALQLARAGRAVRVATIPCPAGQSKIDVNELVATKGPAALKAVLDAAVDPGSHLISRIPSDAPAQAVSAAFGEVLSTVPCDDPVVRQGWVDLAKARFGLKGEALKALKARVFPARAKEPAAPSNPGELAEVDGAYWTVTPQGPGRPVSDFVFRPRRLVVLEDGEEAFETDIVPRSGRTLKGVQLPKRSWSSRNAMVSSLKSVDTVWCGTDDQTQWLLHSLADGKTPRVAGSRTCGYRELDGVPYWVEPTRTLTAEGEAPDGTLVFWNTGDDLSRRLRPLSPVDPAEERRMAAYVIPRLMELNPPAVMLPVIGWFFAAPLRPRLHRLLGHFPVLCVWGTQGSGKTSLVRDVFRPLLGFSDPAPTSVTDTEFTLVRRLSASASVPAFLDEYKPGDMTQQQRGRLHRLLRRVYSGEAECRGRADLSVVRYDLSAPVCLCGETRPTEPALMERIVTACPDKESHAQGGRASAAFHELQAADTGMLARGIVQHLLSTDTDAVLAEARARLASVPGAGTLPERVRDNLLAVVCGLVHFEGYARLMGVDVGRTDVGDMVSAQLEDVLDGKPTSVKTGADQFLERLSDMAVAGQLQRYGHFTWTGDGLLALHLGACLIAYGECCRRTQDGDEVVDRKMLARQFREVQRAGGYVVDTCRVVSFHGVKRRALVVDLGKARAAGLEVDDFPPDEERRPCASGRWEPD